MIALVDETDAYERLAAALRGHARLERVRTWPMLDERIACAPPPIVVLGIRAEAPWRTDSALRELRRSWPRTKLVLLCPLDERSLDALFRLHGSAADDLVVPALHDLATIRRRVLDRPDRRIAAARLRALLAGCVAEALEPMLDWCLSQLEEGDVRASTVADMAHDVGRSRGEIERRFRRVGTGTPHDLIAWVRVLLAVHLLETRPVGLAVVAEDIGLSSARALGRLVKRKTGVTPGEINQHGGMMLAIRLFRDHFGRWADTATREPSDAEHPIVPAIERSANDQSGSVEEPFVSRRAEQR